MLIIEYKESFSAVPDSTITVNNTFPGTGERFPGIHPTRPRAETTRWRNNFAGAHSEQRQHRPASRWEKILLENYRFILIYFLIDGRLATLESSRSMLVLLQQYRIWQARTSAKLRRSRVGSARISDAETDARYVVGSFLKINAIK